MVIWMSDADLVPVAALDRAPAADAAAMLSPACASTRWIRRLVDGRPYDSLDRLIAASDAAIGALSWPDIEEALAAHPRIGNRAPTGAGEPAADPPQAPESQPSAGSPPAAESPGRESQAPGEDREAAWSQQEQAGAAAATPDVQAALRAGNLAYETRFGHIFLICATGQSATDMLAALRQRLSNEPGAEREIVRDELRRIVRLRLAKAFR
jgi:2-oxo-4-hydroxy-4-carboxy-5-ureidoimidazoline decarboxylase